MRGRVIIQVYACCTLFTGVYVCVAFLREILLSCCTQTHANTLAALYKPARAFTETLTDSLSQICRKTPAEQRLAEKGTRIGTNACREKESQCVLIYSSWQ